MPVDGNLHCLNIKKNIQLGEYIKIERGVRQACTFSSDIFNVYNEMRNIKILHDGQYFHS